MTGMSVIQTIVVINSSFTLKSILDYVRYSHNATTKDRGKRDNALIICIEDTKESGASKNKAQRFQKIERYGEIKHCELVKGLGMNVEEEDWGSLYIA